MDATPTRAVRDSSTSDQVRETLREALSGRGGRNRCRLLRALGDRPRNANRLAAALNLDYKTVRHHLSVLESAGAVTRAGDGYGAVYVPTERMRQRWDLLDAVGRDAD
jgi:DNA-binding transcriptional ArsR family regulator